MKIKNDDGTGETSPAVSSMILADRGHRVALPSIIKYEIRFSLSTEK